MIVKNKEDFIKRLSENNCVLIEGEYINQKSKFHIKDEYGYEYEVTSASYNLNGCGRKFHAKNPYSISNINNWLKINGLNNKIILISKEYKSNYDKLTWICLNCGKEFKVSFNIIKRSNFSGMCKKCSMKKGQENNKNKNTLKEIENMGFDVISGKCGSHEDIIVKDKGGYLYNTTYNRLVTMKKTPLKTFKGNTFNRYNLNTWIKNNNLNKDIILLEYYYKNNNIYIIYKCMHCGEIYNKKFNEVKKLASICQKCSDKTQSCISKRVEEYLIKNKLKYIKEYRIDNCRNKNPLPFDFYLPDYDICIEVDGKQHYEPTRFGGVSEEKALDNFKELKNRDNIKTQYCKDNNIKLIRIPYWEFNDDTYINTLNKEIK